jgi:RHS repeat-associated protein
MREDFTPDALNRLSVSKLNSVQNLALTYDASGNIVTRSDVGTFTYDPVRKHLLKTAGSAFSASYDANGNVTTLNTLSQTWASFNLPINLQVKTGSTIFGSSFTYGPEHERYKQLANYSNGQEITYYAGGLFEKVTGSATPTTYYRHYIPSPSGAGIIVYRNSNNITTTDFALTDHLGSTDVVVSGTGASSGNVLVRESFDAFGQRRQSNWTAGSPTSADYSAIAGTTRRGFTFHEQLDNIQLTHMNGRVYSPITGRFLSVDPAIADLSDSQSVNPYAYIGNRPLSFVDPTGLEGETIPINGNRSGGDSSLGGVLGLLGKAWGGVTHLFSGLFGGHSQPPAANALPGSSAEAGIGLNPCSGGCAGSLPEVIVQSATWIGPEVVGLSIPGYGTATNWEAAPPGLPYVATITVRGQFDASQWYQSSQASPFAAFENQPNYRRIIEGDFGLSVLPYVPGYDLANCAFGGGCGAGGWGLAALGILPVPEAGATKGVARVLENRKIGNDFRDELAGLLQQAGRGVRTEVYKKTPFGKRFMDIEVSQGETVLGGIETKVGTSRYGTIQRLKDWWLTNIKGYPVNVARKP